VAAGLLFGITGRRPGWRRLQMACFGFALAAVWYGIYDTTVLAPVKAMDGHTEPMTVRVTDYSYRTDYGLAAEGEITQGGRTFRIKFYLNDMDHFIKEKLKIKYYVRYQDDFILFHQSKEYLKECLEKINKFLEKEKLE